MGLVPRSRAIMTWVLEKKAQLARLVIGCTSRCHRDPVPAIPTVGGDESLRICAPALLVCFNCPEAWPRLQLPPSVIMAQTNRPGEKPSEARHNSTRAHTGDVMGPQPMLFSTSTSTLRGIGQSVLAGPVYTWWVRGHLGGCSPGHTRD